MRWIFGVSLIAIAVSLTVAGTPAGPSIDEAALRFLPPETVGIAFIDLAALRNAPLVQELLNGKNFKLPYRVEEFSNITGFDPQRDLDRVTFAKINDRDGFVVAQGRVDRFKVEQYFRDKGRQPEGYLGHSLYRDGNGALALIDDVVVAGQLNAVKKAIDQRQLPGSQPLRAELVAAVEAIEAGNQVWGVGEVAVRDLERAGVKTPAPITDLMRTLRTGTFQMRVDDAVHAKATGTFADAQSAKNIGDLALGMLAVGKLQLTKQKPELAPLLDGIQVSSSGTTVSVRIEATRAALQGLGKL
jgi:hypothetical protein